MTRDLGRIFMVAGLAALAACSDASSSGTGEQACTKTAECPRGLTCKDAVCQKIPCGGTCAADEVCRDESCTPADGVACPSGASDCPPTGFLCTPNAECQRTCTLDNECSSPGFRKCNTDANFCGECAVGSDCAEKTGKKCDSLTARCVECSTNADCKVDGVSVGKYCDDATKTCKQGCETGADCQAGQKCDGATASNPGRCIECKPATSTFDCATSPRLYCEPQKLVCVECLQKSQCSRDCNTTTNKCVECVDNETCAKGFICNQETNACVPGCAGGKGGPNCPTAAPACDANRGDTGTCVRCMVDADCGRAQVCKLNGTGGMPECIDGCVLLDNTVSDAKCAAPAGVTPAPINTVCDRDKGTGRGKCVDCIKAAGGDAKCAGHNANLPYCDDELGQCRCALQGEACTLSSACGVRETISGQEVIRCNANQAVGVVAGVCVTQVDCDGISCGGGQKDVVGVGKCGTPSRGGLRCDAKPYNCPAGLIADFGFTTEQNVSVDQAKMLCVPTEVSCAK